MKWIHAADVHLGTSFASASFGREQAGRRRRELKETLLRLIRLCGQEGYDALLIAGDLYEEKFITISELLDVNEAFAGLTKTRVFIAAGNHDPLGGPRSPYRLIEWAPNVHLFGPGLETATLETEEGKLAVHSFSWTEKTHPKLDLDPLAKKLEAWPDEAGWIHAAMLHGTLGEGGVYMPMDLKALQALPLDYIALGHIHKPEAISTRCAYAGSLEPLDFKETGAHGYIDCRYEDGRLRMARVPFAKRRFERLDCAVDEAMTLEGIKTAMEAVLAGAVESLGIGSRDMVRMTFTGFRNPEVALDQGLLKEALEAHVFYGEIVDETEPDLDIEGILAEHGDSLIGRFIRKMQALDQEDPVNRAALKEGLQLLLKERGSL